MTTETVKDSAPIMRAKDVVMNSGTTSRYARTSARFIATILALPLLEPQPASAQSVAGVLSPVVNAGHVSAEYRLGHVLDGERSVHRLHYQRALNDDLMWRIAVQGRRAPGAPFDLDILGAEVTWQISDNADAWQSGLRFDLRYRERRKVGSIGINWANEFKPTDRLTLRLVGLSAFEVGDNARKGVLLQSRARFAWMVAAGTTIGIEAYNIYGSTSGFPELRNQTHQTGPFASLRISDSWQVFATVLVGLTNASPSEEMRLRIGRRF